MKRYKEYKDSGVQWIGQVPTHWILSKLKYGLKGMQDGTHGSYESVISENPLLSAKNVFEDGLHISDAERTISQKDYDSIVANGFPQYNDIVLCCVGTIGRCCIYKMKTPLAFQRSVTFLRVNKSLNPIFLLYSLRSDIFKPQYELYAKTTAQSGIYMGTVANMAIILPPLPEQQAIASFLDAKTKPIDDIIAKREKQIELLEEMKSTIISRAVTKGLNPDAKMKDSGIEWIGEIPDHWDVKCIKYIKANVPNAFVDCPFGSNLKSQHYVEDGDVYVIESGFITSGKFEYVRDMKTITEEHFETIKRSECKENDIIIAKIGAYFGMAAVLPKLDKKSVVSGNSLKITLDNTIMLNDIFVYLMACSKKQNGYIGVVNETAQPALSLYNLNHFKLPVAPLEEQKSIASYLDSETSKIDSRIAKRRKQIELLQEYKQALITAAVTGKMDVRELNS